MGSGITKQRKTDSHNAVLLQTSASPWAPGARTREKWQFGALKLQWQESNQQQQRPLHCTVTSVAFSPLVLRLIVWFTTNGMSSKNKNICMWREQAIKSDLVWGSLLLLVGTVRSFAHMSLRISDRNTRLHYHYIGISELRSFVCADCHNGLLLMGNFYRWPFLCMYDCGVISRPPQYRTGVRLVVVKFFLYFPFTNLNTVNSFPTKITKKIIAKISHYLL